MRTHTTLDCSAPLARALSTPHQQKHCGSEASRSPLVSSSDAGLSVSCGLLIMVPPHRARVGSPQASLASHEIKKYMPMPPPAQTATTPPAVISPQLPRGAEGSSSRQCVSREGGGGILTQLVCWLCPEFGNLQIPQFPGNAKTFYLEFSVLSCWKEFALQQRPSMATWPALATRPGPPSRF